MISNRSIYRVGWLGRLSLRTPYPAVIERVGYIMNRLPRDTSLVVDYGGVGKGIYDMLVDSGLAPIGVTMTGGFEVHWAGGNATVPKSTLISKLVAVVHAGELFVHQELSDWPVLKRELMNFRPEVTAAGRETWNARSGTHDDLVIATALCAWHLQGGEQPYAGLLRHYAQLAGRVDLSEKWCVGVDLGQSVDPTAICVMSRIDRPSAADTAQAGFVREMGEGEGEATSFRTSYPAAVATGGN
jgi:hypothetical protein